MAVVVVNRTFTDDQNRTLNFPFFSGYDRVKASYTIDVEFSFVINPLNSIEKVGDSFTLNNGQSWEDYGFYAGATITGHYENGSTHNIPSSTTIVFVDGATMFLSNTLAGTDGTYTIGTLTIDSLPDAIGFDFNLVENTSTGSEFSVIDGEVNRFNADVSALTVSGTVVPSQLGNKSGGSQITTLITRLADVSGNRRYQIDISFNPWTVKNPDLYFSTGCVKPWIRIDAFPEYQNPSVKISTVNVPSDANVGLTNEVGNGGTPDYTLGYINLEDGDGNPLPSIDYNQETYFEIRVNGVFNSSSKFNLTLWHDTTDDTEFKNLPTNFDQNNIVIKNNSALAFSASPFAPIYSPTRTDGVELSIEDITSTSHGTYAIFTGKVVPNSSFTNLINDKQPTDRLYKLWIRCENPSLTSNDVRPVWVNVQESVFSKAIVPLGTYGMDISISNHEENTIRSANDVIIEDDIRMNSTFKVPKFNDFERISVSLVVANGVTEEIFNLESYGIDLSTLPELPDGTKPINFVLNRGFKLSPTNPNNVVNIIRNPLLDDSDEYGVKIEYSALIRWEYWLEQLGTALAFYVNSTKNWFNYQTGDWVVGFLIQIDTPDGSYQDFELLDIHNYDDWTVGTGTTTVEYFSEDGVTAITKPIIGELTHVKMTFTNALFSVGGAWGQLTAEGFELSPRWDLSSVWNWSNVIQNPWKPLSGEIGMKLTQSGTSKIIEGLLDVTKLPNPNKVSITGRISQKGGDAPIEVRHKVTTETARVPRQEDLDDRGKTGNCCDCIYEVFADENSTETYRNHVSSRWMIGETVSFELYKDGVLASFQPTTQTFPNDTGAFYCTIPWRDVLISDGRGCYTLKGISESAGIETEKTLGVFKLEQFDWSRLVDKIMIRSVFNDANIREQINFTNAEVQDCIVIDGDIEEYQPNTQINNLVKANFEQVKVKRENRTLWTININFADFCHMKRLTDLHLVGENQMFVSDFRKDAFDKTLLDKAVILNETANLTPIYRSERQKATFVVAEKIVDHLTRFGSVVASGEVNAGDLPLPNVVNEQMPIDVTINGITVADDAISDVSLTLVDQNGDDVPFTQTGTELEVEIGGDAYEWLRPSDWLPLDTITNGSNKFSGLFAVYENGVNVCTMQIFTGSHTINWGDGTTQTIASGVLYTKTYNYATLVSPILVDEWGCNYKMVVVNVGLVGSTGIYIDRNYVGGQISRTLGWLDIALDCSTMDELFISTNLSDGRAYILQRLLIYDLKNNMSSLQLANCINLRILKLPFNKLASSASVNFTNSFFNTTDENNLPLSINTNFANLNLSGTRIIKLGDLILPNVTTSTQNFMLNALNVNEIGNITIPLSQTIQNFQFGNYNLVKQGVITTSTALTSINNAWYECRNLKEIILTQCSNVTVVGQAFYLTTSLEKLILTGLRIGFSIAQSTLSATALNDLFTSLGTASGSQTITITGNPGATTCDPTIATSKGFTVVI